MQIGKYIILLAIISTLTISIFFFLNPSTNEERLITKSESDSNTLENLSELSTGTEIEEIYDIYISTEGNNENSGTINKPIKTLNRAREIIRNLPRPLKQSINVYLREGTYLLTEPFVLDDIEKDSGDYENAITYQSYPEEKAIITSEINPDLNWQKQNSFYVADVSRLIEQYKNFESLFVDGKRATKSRIPNMGYYTINKTDKDNNSAFFFNSGEIRNNWKNLNDIEIVPSMNWIQSRFKIKEIDETKNKIYLSGKTNPYSFGFGQDRYYIENIFEGLSEGEWYLDKNEKKLYYWPKENEKINELKFSIPTLTTLIQAGNYSKLREESNLDYLEIKDSASVDKGLSFNNDFTISMFFKVISGVNDFQNPSWILSKGYAWDENGLAIVFIDGKLQLIINDGFGKYPFSTSGEINDGSRPIIPESMTSYKSYVNEWLHVAWTVDRTSGKIKSYAKGNYRGFEYDVDISNLGNITAYETPLFIGQLKAEGLNGAIDELKIYNRVLTDDEIKSLSENEQISNNKLELSLSFEKNFNDDGNGNTPLIQGNPKFINGSRGKAIAFEKRTIINENEYNSYLTNVNFKNMEFTYTDYKISQNGYPGSQTDYYLNNPTILLITKNSEFENNIISHTGEYALYSCSKNSKISNNDIEDTGAGAIRIGDAGELWNYILTNKISNSNEITDNKISNTGNIFAGSPAITILHSGDNLINNNEISNTSYSGISLGWFTPTSWQTFMSNNKIEYNYIHDIMQKLNDGGGIYLLGKQPGTTVTNNLIKNIKQTQNHLSNQYLFGLYFDNAEDIVAKYNLIQNADYSGIIFYNNIANQRSTNKNNTVENNIFIDSGKYQTFFNSYDDTFTKNIIYYHKNLKNTSLFYSETPGIIKKSNYNIFYTAISPVYRFWNEQTNTHFYTISEEEKDHLIETYYQFIFEGPAFYAYETQTEETKPVYRFWNNQTNTHFYTISEEEKDKLIEKYHQFIFEGPAFYAYETQTEETKPVYRFWNNQTNTHFYTISEEEKDKLIEKYHQFIFEGPAFYTYENTGQSLISMLNSWKSLGYDKNSIITNPLFEDYENENFNLKEKSPAFNLGFESFNYPKP